MNKIKKGSKNHHPDKEDDLIGVGGGGKQVHKPKSACTGKTSRGWCGSSEAGILLEVKFTAGGPGRQEADVCWLGRTLVNHLRRLELASLAEFSESPSIFATSARASWLQDSVVFVLLFSPQVAAAARAGPGRRSF